MVGINIKKDYLNDELATKTERVRGFADVTSTVIADEVGTIASKAMAPILGAGLTKFGKWVDPKVTDMGPMISQWNVPKYWTYLSESGEKYYVIPHALKHSEELEVTLFKNNPDYMNIVGKTYMDNVHGAINEITSQGAVIWGKICHQ